MKNYLLVLSLTIAVLLYGAKLQAQNNVGIGTALPNSKAILELKATDKGFLAPRLNTTQMNGIATTVTESALLIYNTDSACYHFYNGTAWKNLCQKGLDTAAINKLIKNYLNNNSTTVINILKGDTAFFNVTTINQATINILKVDTSITNVAIINQAIIDSATINNANINILTVDTSYTNVGNFNTLNVGGQNIMNTITDSIAAQAWLLNGNTIIGVKKLGTLNAKDLHIVANSQERITILQANGFVGINQTTPAQQLDVAGNLQFSGALMPATQPGTAGQLLTSAGANTPPVWVSVASIVPPTTVSNTSTTNTLTTTVNGVTGAGVAIINTVSNTYNSTTGSLNTIVNGVAGANVLLPTNTSITDSIKKQAWLLKGNTGTLAGTNFIGTTDAVDFVTKTNGIQRMRTNAAGQVYINATGSGASDVFSVRANNALSTTSNTVGLYAVSGYSSAGTGVYGGDNSNGDGVEGGSLNGTGVYGSSTNYKGVWGNSTTNDGVYGSANGGLTVGVDGHNFNANGTGVLGRGNYNAGDITYVNITGSGGAFNGDNVGVVGYALNSAFGIPFGTSSSGGYFSDSINSVSKTFSRTAAYTSGTKYKVVGDGAASTIVKDNSNNEHIMYCTEAPEILFEDYGSGQLINGEAVIKIDPLYAFNIIVNDKHKLRVFIQLDGDCNGVFVTNKSAEGFTVKELNGGKSNVAFTYHVIGNRKDEVINGQVASKYQDNRFPSAVGLREVPINVTKQTPEAKPARKQNR